jgi:hypothetical protein
VSFGGKENAKGFGQQFEFFNEHCSEGGGDQIWKLENLLRIFLKKLQIAIFSNKPFNFFLLY